MPVTRAGEVELFYERTGSGPPLLMIMGMSGSHLSWGEPFLEQLRKDFEVIVYDHRGIGQSSRMDRDFTLVELADDAAALLDALELERADVVAISMGGMVAQELALRSPERVRTLTLGCTYCGGAGSSLTAQPVIQRLTEGLASGDRELAIRTAWEVNVSPAFAAHEDAYQAWRGVALELPIAVPVIMAQMRAVLGHDTSTRLPGLQVPTLVIHGSEDQMLSVDNGRLIAKLVPGARLEVLEGVGHVFFWEQPERSAELVREHALTGADRQPA